MANHDLLSQRLVPYIPSTLIKWYAEHSANEIHLVSQLQGTLICIDASGFTALTKELGKDGRGGSETLTLILNCFFEEMASAVFAHRGDILKFAGDALWAYFSDTFDAPRFMRLVLDNLERSNATYPLTKERPLSIHAGAEFGSFSLASLGDSQRRLEIEPIGPLVDEVSRLCDLAQTNQLFAGIQLSKSLSTGTTRLTCHGSYFEVKPADDISGTTPVENEGLVFRAQPIPQLEKYLPADVLARLHSSGNSLQLQSEHRQVVALFGYFQFDVGETRTITPDSITRLNSIMAKAFTMIHELNGSIARIDPYDHGHKLLILFGAPKKHEQDELHAIACAQSLLDLGNDEFRIRIGLAFGPLFCGDVGAERRREYTIMGDAANMAARLMSKAEWGQILLDSALRKRLPDDVGTSSIILPLKGIGADVTCFKLAEVSECHSIEVSHVTALGQKDELAQLIEAWSAVKEGRAKVINLFGPAGIGKTTLMTRFNSQLKEEESVFISCTNSILFGHGWLAKRFLHSVFMTDSFFTDDKLAQHVTALVDPKWGPLVGDLVGSDPSDNNWTAGLSSDLRNRKVKEIFQQLISDKIQSPRVIIIDDFAWADAYSKQLILSLAEISMRCPLLIVVVSRNTLPTTGSELPNVEHLRLESPTTEEWQEFARQRLEDGKRERELFHKLLSTSGGNPQCVIEFLHRAQERGQLIVNTITGKWELQESSAVIEYPKSVMDVHLSRFDSLPEDERHLLKAAAAYGNDFEADHIAAVRGISDIEVVKRQFRNLCDAGLLMQESENNRLAFAHSSMCDAVYSCIPQAERQSLHTSIANIIEMEGASRREPMLAHHYFHGGRFEQAFKYSLLAAIEASKIHSLIEAASHFEKCRTILEKNRCDRIDASERFHFYRAFSKDLALEGKYNETYPLFRKWRRLGKQMDLESESIDASIETARVLWRQSKYSRSRRLLVFLLDSGKLNAFPAALVGALLVQAEVERRTGGFRKARELCIKGIRVARENNVNAGLADAHNKLGLALWGEGRLKEAAANFETSLKLARHQDGMYAQAQTTNNLAIIHWELGDFNQARRGLDEAISVFNEIGDRRNEAYAMGNLASLYRIGGQFCRSEELYRRADFIFERLEDEHAHFYTEGNLGDLYLILGELEIAESSFRQTQAFAKKVGDKELEAECEVRFGDLAFFSREMSSAESRYLKAIEKAKEVCSVEYEIRARIGLARLYIYDMVHDKADLHIDQISKSAKETAAVLAQQEAIFLLGEKARVAGDLDVAAEMYLKVFDYARGQRVFELILKSAIRLFEVDSGQKPLATEVIVKLVETFIEENGLTSWQQLISSAYFSFFRTSLQKILLDNKATRQLVDFHSM